MRPGLCVWGVGGCCARRSLVAFMILFLSLVVSIYEHILILAGDEERSLILNKVSRRAILLGVFPSSLVYLFISGSQITIDPTSPGPPYVTLVLTSPEPYISCDHVVSQFGPDVGRSERDRHLHGMLAHHRRADGARFQEADGQGQRPAPPEAHTTHAHAHVHMQMHIPGARQRLTQ